MKKYLFLLFFTCFIIYNLNFSALYPYIPLDTVPSAAFPFNLLSGKGIYFDEFAKILEPKVGIAFFQKSHGHYVSTYSLIPGLISTPFYVPTYAYLKMEGLADDTHFFNYIFILEKISASIFASTSVVLFFLLIYLLTKSKKSSLLFSFIFAFATQQFSINSQQLWQHVPATLFCILSQLIFLKGMHDSSKATKMKLLCLSLVFGIICFYSRPTYFLYLLPLMFFILKMDKKNWPYYILILFAGVSLQLSYNFSIYHTLLGGYGIQASLWEISGAFQKLLGIFFSPAKGIIFYTPLLFIALLSILFLNKMEIKDIGKRNIYSLNIVFLIFVLILNCFWGNWWGGNSWGNRLLTDAAASAVILSFFLLQAVTSKLLKILFCLVIIYSVFVQIIGVFYYPKAIWDQYPKTIEQDRARLWNFQDTPIIRNLLLGPQQTGYYRLYYSINRLDAKIYLGMNRKCSLEKVEEKTILGYDVLRVRLKNNSATNWLTAGKHPITIRQVYLDSGLSGIESRIPSSDLPPIIKGGDESIVSLILIPPIGGSNDILIAPVQEGASWWFSSCSLELNKAGSN